MTTTARPTLSLLLVTKNGLPFAARAIEQIESHRARFGAEVVAIDGASTDGTWPLLAARDAWIARIQQGDGLASARNEAIRLASGDLLAFLDADDEWLPEKMERQLGVLAAAPEIDVVSVMLRKVGPNGDGSLHPGWTPSGCLFRRRAFERVGLFDPALRIACDHQWFIRARQAGLPMHLIEDCLLLKTVHDGSLSSRRAQYRTEMLRVLRDDV